MIRDGLKMTEEESMEEYEEAQKVVSENKVCLKHCLFFSTSNMTNLLRFTGRRRGKANSADESLWEAGTRLCAGLLADLLCRVGRQVTAEHYSVGCQRGERERSVIIFKVFLIYHTFFKGSLGRRIGRICRLLYLQCRCRYRVKGYRSDNLCQEK